MNQEFNETCAVQTDEEVRTEANEWATSLKDKESNEIINTSNLGGQPLDFTKQ